MIRGTRSLVLVVASVVGTAALLPATDAAAYGEDRSKGPRSGTDVVVAAAGDIACRPGSEPSSGKCQQKATSDLALDMNPDAVLVLGDNQSRDGELSEYRGAYDPTWGRFLGKTHPVPGNHDYDTPHAEGYFDYFGERAGDPDKGYYSFNLGGWHLIALNSNCDEVGGCDAGSAQERWLRADLAANAKRCTLAFWHAPRYSSGEYRGSSRATRDLWKVLYEAQAELVLSGHAQHYERFVRQDEDGDYDPQGMRQFVVGTGGQDLHPLDERLGTTARRNNDTFGVLKLTLHPGSYNWEFVPVPGSGGYTDSGRAACRG